MNSVLVNRSYTYERMAHLSATEKTTGIEAVNADAKFNADAPAYNMAGQRVDASFKGLVIKGGKKVVIK